MTPRWLLPAGALALLLPACSGGGEAAPTTAAATQPPTTTAAPTTTSTTTTSTTTTSTTTTTTTSSTTTTTTLPPVHRQPLNGAVVKKKSDIIKRPALAVKIDNAPGARRNHRGLASADIVYEEIVEGSITRFAAVFHSQGSDPVGPIRSGRSQDVDMLRSFDHPLFAWSGGNPGVTQLIAESPLTDLNWQKNGGAYYRSWGSAPHNLYSSTERLWNLTPDGHPGAPPQQFRYLRPGKKFAQGRKTTGVDLAMRAIDVTWEWDPESKRFLRFQEGGPHIDVLNGQIGATNVVIMVAEYKPSQIDARSPEAQTVANAPVYVLSNGRVVRGRWSRESADDPVKLVAANGKPIRLTPGNTWVELAEALQSDDPANPADTVDLRLDE